MKDLKSVLLTKLWKPFWFSIISASVFLVLLAVLYSVYGYEFLYETYLYHLVRKDNRHNFSLYFYHLYLTSSDSVIPFPELQGIITTLPQLLIQLVFAVNFYQDLPFCFFVQTYSFVVFNKVCTAQYFIWYLSLFPLVLPALNVTMKKLLFGSFVWVLGQGLWLYFAYHLEFKGVNTFRELWFAGMIFFSVNVFLLSKIIANYQHQGNDLKRLISHRWSQ